MPIKNPAELLKKMEQHDLHVHEIDAETRLPVFLSPLDSHYIMKGPDIVWAENINSIEHYVFGNNESKRKEF